MANAYKLVSAPDTDGLVFRQRSQVGCLVVVFGLIGTAGLTLGGLLFLYGLAGPGLLALGFGIAFGAVAPLIWAQRFQDPARISFLNSAGAVCVEQRLDDPGQTAYIPYGDIAGFRFRRRTSSASNGSRVKVYYQAYWEKKDGACWDLATFSRSEEAAAFVDALEAKVDWSRPTTASIRYRLPDAIESTRVRGHRAFSWRNTVQLGQLMAMGPALGFVTIGLGLVVFADGQGKMEMAGGFVAVFGGIIVLLLLWSLYDTLRTAHRVVVTTHDVQLLQVKEGQEEVKYVLPAKEISSLRFNLDDNTGGGMLEFMTRAQEEEIRKWKEGEKGWKDWRDALQFLKGPISVLVSLSVVERIHFEAILQQAIREETGHDVL
jgi:hypothetical protein